MDKNSKPPPEPRRPSIVLSLGRRFSVYSIDVLHSLEWADLCLHQLSPCLSPMFVCCSGDLVVHMLIVTHICTSIEDW